MNPLELTAAEIQRAVAGGRISARAVTESFLARTDEMERRVQAFLTLTPELSRDRASSLDDALARGEPAGKLAGVPVAVKDVLTTRGVRTTAGSRVLENYVPPYDATAVSRLLAEGAVILGKTNLDEFAMGSSTENSAFQKTRNPWDPDRVPGGSSGGSAAAVAAREVPAALGSDTGGSIRQPAALSGVVGLKPTYGRVSRYGLIAFASSLDQVGPLCRTVEDAALFLEVLSGHDPLDSTSSAVPVADYRAQLDGGVAGLNLGIPRKALEQGLQADVRESYDRAVALLEGVGARTIEVDLPHAELAVACYYLIATAEASSNLARYDGVRYGRRAEAHLSLPEMYGATRDQGFGTEVKRRILLGTYVLSAGYYEAYYLKAQKVRTLIARDFHQAFERVDAVLLPTSPTTAFRFGERLQDPLQMYLSDVFTITANLAGIPGISIPAGLDREGLPVGVQILGRHFDEATVLRVARALEKLAGFENVPRPPLAD